MPKFEIRTHGSPAFVAPTEREAVSYLHQLPAHTPVEMTNVNTKARVPDTYFPAHSVPSLYPIIKFGTNGGMEIPLRGYTVRFGNGEMMIKVDLLDVYNRHVVGPVVLPVQLWSPSERMIGEFYTTDDVKSLLSAMLKNECVLTWYEANGKVVDRSCVYNPSEFLASEKRNKKRSHFVSLVRADGEQVFSLKITTVSDCVSYLISRYRITR